MKRSYVPPTVESSGPWRGIEDEANAFEIAENDLWRGGDYDPKVLRTLLRRAVAAGIALAVAEVQEEPREPQ